MVAGQKNGTEALPVGTVILGGQYEIVQLLHQRPRVNLYMGRRLPARGGSKTISQHAQEYLVAIREVVLTGLAPQAYVEIEHAAFEEFVSPLVPGSPRLPGAVDRVVLEGERHYLLMHLHSFKGIQHGQSGQDGQSVTLAKLLLSWRTWPTWLDEERALRWGAQLCRIVARLHRSGIVLGDLDPTLVLVDGAGVAAWEPTLLVFWPPAPIFWSPTEAAHLSGVYASRQHGPAAVERYQQIFPLPRGSMTNAFAAPETLTRAFARADARADVYSLGAILYLLLTRYAPVAAAHRLGLLGETGLLDSIGLIAPQQLNRQISARVDELLLRALAIEPARRFQTVFEMAEEIEAVVDLS